MATTINSTGVVYPDGSIDTFAANTALSNIGLAYPVKFANMIDGSNMRYRGMMFIMSDGSVKGIGHNSSSDYGMSGTGCSVSYFRKPFNVAFPSYFPGAKEVYLGRAEHQACLDVNGEYWTWGYNTQGACGNGQTNRQRAVWNASRYPSNGIYGKTVVQASLPAGTENTTYNIVRTSDGMCYAAGYNAFGQVGNGSTADVVNTFTRCGTLTGVTHVFTGRERYTCAGAIAGGVLYTWGYNGDGQLGSGNSTSTSTPTARTGGSLSGKTIVDAQSGYTSIWALASDGTLHVCGGNQDYHHGLGLTGNTTAFAQTNTNVRSFMVRGYDYPVVTIIKNDDTVYFSGRTSFLRQSSTNDGGWNQILCYQGTAFGASNPVQQVIHGGSGSYNSIFVLTTSGEVWAYGANGYGTLGLGVTNNDVFWYQSANFAPFWTGQTSNVWSNKVRIDPVAAMACCGEGQETAVWFLTSRGKVKAAGYGGDSGNGEPYVQSISSPLRLDLV